MSSAIDVAQTYSVEVDAGREHDFDEGKQVLAVHGFTLALVLFKDISELLLDIGVVDGHAAVPGQSLESLVFLAAFGKGSRAVLESKGSQEEDACIDEVDGDGNLVDEVVVGGEALSRTGGGAVADHNADVDAHGEDGDGKTTNGARGDLRQEGRAGDGLSRLKSEKSDWSPKKPGLRMNPYETANTKTCDESSSKSLSQRSIGGDPNGCAQNPDKAADLNGAQATQAVDEEESKEGAGQVAELELTDDVGLKRLQRKGSRR